jgi:hypothetical protein
MLLDAYELGELMHPPLLSTRGYGKQVVTAKGVVDRSPFSSIDERPAHPQYPLTPLWLSIVIVSSHY